MTAPRSNTRKAVWLYPIRGIELTGDKDELTLTDYASLWTKAKALDYIKRIRYSPKTIEESLESLNLHAFIAVEYRSPNYLLSEGPIPKFQKFPTLAAREIALRGLAVLHFITMTNSSSQHRCVLADELPNFERHDFVHDFDSESLLQSGASIDLSEPLKRTAENLSKQFEAQSQSSLFDILRNYSSKKADKHVRQLLISASQHLAKSNHQWSESERLLTAITAIEMLMSANSNDSDYKKLKNRIATLLGAEYSEQLGLEATFKMRNNLVHNGTSCTSSKSAIELAASCLVNFSNLASNLQTFSLPKGLCLRDATLSYLDFLHQAHKLSWLDLPHFAHFEPVELTDLRMD